jgi:hypothetical protein
MRLRRALSFLSETFAWLLLAAAVLGAIAVVYWMARFRAHRGNF